MSLPCLRRKSVLSTDPISKPFARKNVFKSSYQALGAYFKPYKVFWSLNTEFGNLGFSKPGVA
jgi:hypothetical protein